MINSQLYKLNIVTFHWYFFLILAVWTFDLICKKINLSNYSYKIFSYMNARSSMISWLWFSNQWSWKSCRFPVMLLISFRWLEIIIKMWCEESLGKCLYYACLITAIRMFLVSESKLISYNHILLLNIFLIKYQVQFKPMSHEKQKTVFISYTYLTFQYSIHLSITG